MAVIVVTGGAGGIGQAVAARLGRAGDTVILADRDEQAADRTRATLSPGGGTFEVMVLDVNDSASVEAGFGAIIRRHARIDGLVNSAGLSIRGPSEDVTLASWDTVLGVNLRGTFLCCQAAGRQMIRQKKGRIVNIGSTAAAGGFPGRAAYCASKAGVVALTQVLASEWARHGVRVNCVSPAHTRTAILEDAIRGGFVNEQDLLKRLPVGRLGETSDVAEVVAFLIKSESDFVTGVNWYVDGGWTALGIS